MKHSIAGIHHVTAIAGDPRRNLEFYTGVLGLRLVKLTVNYDDPGTYHLYYGDYSGSPGTILTFFPWRGVPQGRPGTGQITVTSFSVPAGSLAYWEEKLTGHGVPFSGPEPRFDEKVLTLQDYDGMGLELVEAGRVDTRPGWPGGPVPSQAAIRGFHAATLAVGRYESSVRLLMTTMGFRETNRDGDRRRFETGEGGPGATVDLVETSSTSRGREGAGSVHHIAWRTPDDDAQREWMEELRKGGAHVSPVMDRKYFHSIYYREPSGILFEIATDPPGFTVDESLETLGQKLVLPAWLEPRREELVKILPSLEVQHA